MGLFGATGDGSTTLQNAGSIAAIVGASVTVLVVTAGVARWWWRHHGVRAVNARIHAGGEEQYLEITGLPASADTVAA
jgi:hypothetical protein